MSIELSEAERFISWINTKAHLNSIAPNASGRFVKRGQVYWCQFGINIGSEMSKCTPRPAVIVGNYSINKNSSNTLVVPVTHNTKSLPYLIPLAAVKDETGNVILDGQVNTASVICVSKARLGDFITMLSPAQMRSIDQGMAIALELAGYYKNEKEKYERLSAFVEQVKRDRNDAQNTVRKLQAILAADGFSEEGQEKIKKALDMQ